ncbi:BnaA03g49650D [Brassica napus]|uniref:Dolichyl-diphosphooligosaccharide-protein glycosyltransferase subunit OST5 n=1 Tax=Brassica napus TaxID=3708 RepID=A0A078GUM4_BRANA|nr:BnaA03g49650D [Brassica napus]
MYPTLSVVTLAIGLVITAFFYICVLKISSCWMFIEAFGPTLYVYYEATSSRKNRSLGKELATAAVASVFLGFGSLFLLLASGVYV